tara:strand:- start:297 stop:1100 length:804 start_codon:yes stop_codon:yes gene_type:complete
MSQEEAEAGAEAQDQDISDRVLQIKKVMGGYGKNLGISQEDIIIGVDGELFFGTAEEFADYFDIDEDDDIVQKHKLVLTIKRQEAVFNVICHQRISCKFDRIDNPYPDSSTNPAKTLEMAKHHELSEYLIYYDNKKNAELLLRSKSLLAMTVPPFWFLNQRMPEAMVASVLGGMATLTVHWILAVIYYITLCLYVGREQLNMAMGFMSYKRMIYLQSIAAINELQAQIASLAIDNELYFQRPVEGLMQEKKRRKKKSKAASLNAVRE